MIKREELIINGKKFLRHYSDIGNYILQVETNLEYEEAIDVENAPFTYFETDKPIEVINNELRN